LVVFDRQAAGLFDRFSAHGRAERALPFGNAGLGAHVYQYGERGR
jgi:hypothetical protein